jgi:hypothetical protein
MAEAEAARRSAVRVTFDLLGRQVSIQACLIWHVYRA